MKIGDHTKRHMRTGRHLKKEKEGQKMEKQGGRVSKS